MKKLITLLLFGWLASFTAVGQVTFNVDPQTITADQGQNIDINITTDNFTNVISFEFGMNWDETILEFNGISNTNSNLTGYTNAFPSFGPTNITSSLVTSWLEATTVNPVTLPNGSVLFTISFTVVGNPGTGTGVNIINTEVSDNTFSIIPSTSTSGTFTTNGGTSNGPLTMTAGSASDTTGNQVCIPVTVDNFNLIEGFQHSINYDASVLSFDSVGAINLTDLTTGNFNGGNGDLSVTWQDGTTGVGISVPNSTVIYKLYFTIIGAGGTSSNVEFSGDPLSIEVTQGGTNNNPLNTNNGTVTVLGNGGAINGVTFTASDEFGDNGTQVCVDVSVDNFTDLISVQYAMEYDPAILSFNSFQVGANPLGLTAALGSNFSNPSAGLLSFTWNDGSLAGVTLPANTSIYEVCFDILGSAGQSSPFNFTSSAAVPIEIADVNSPPFVNFNEVNGSVTVTGMFDGLNIGYNCSDAAPGESICVDVEVVDGFIDIVSMQYGFSWDETVLNFTGIQFGNGNPLGLVTAADFGLTNVTSGVANVSYLDNTLAGVNLTNGTSLYQVCFDVIGALGSSSPLVFDTSNNTPLEVSDGTGTIINFLGNPCTINIVQNDPLEFDANNTTVTDVNCNGDLTGAIDITVTGGTTPYTFAWSNSVTTEDLSGIGAGTYTVTVTDANSETATATYTVNEPTNALSVTGTATGETSPGAGGAIDITPAGGTSPYTFAWSNSATTEDLSNLAAGTYTVTITDANSCTVEESFTVDAYVCPTISVTGTATGETSPGAGGAIDVSVTGGTGSYTFNWSSGNTTEDLSNIPAGTYTVTATDGDNCTGTMTFTVDAFGCPAITVTGTATDETSVGAGGAVDITVTGGTGSYTYSWSNSQTTEDLSNLIAGTYIVTATDGNNCTGTMTFTVGAYVCPTISITGVVTDESAGGNNGAIDITVSPAGTYTYAWSNSVTNEDLSGIAGGTFTVTATDAAGCTGTETFTVAGFSCPTISVSFSTSDVSCASAGDGSITANPTGGAAPYSYAWAPTGGSTQTISSLVAGTYTVTVTDANDCTATNTTTITAPNAISISVTNTDDLSCQGANDGSITVNVSGGTGTLSVDWGSGMTGTTISNLAAGSYTPTVTDANGCVQSGNAITISEPTALSVTETITDATCNGTADGSVSLNISGGTGAYTVNWSNSTSGTTVSGLPTGTISATISDANGCSISEVYSVGQGQAISITQVVTNETVAGNDGAIDITVSPAGTYTYSWDNGANTEDISGLTAGNYVVIVTASNGCTASASIPVTNSLGIQSDIVTHVTCNGENDGSIDITTYGGEQPYTWIWSTGASTEDLNGVVAGTYTVTISDATGLTSTTEYMINQPTSISITPSVQHEINFCDGSIDLTITGGTAPYTYVWNNGETSEDVFDLCDGVWTVTVTDANGCIATSGNINVNPALPTIISTTVENVSCNGGSDGSISIEILGGDPSFTLTINGIVLTSNSHVFTFPNLAPGSYEITGQDIDNNTFSSGTIIITEPDVLEITSEQIQHASGSGINDGAVYIEEQGGTTPYAYLWNNGDTSADLIGVGPGEYEVTITDANGCTTEGGPYSVGLQMTTSTIVNSVLCFNDNNGSVELNITGGFEPYTFSWTGPNGFISTDQNIFNLVAGQYTCMITDAMGNPSGVTAIVLSPSAPLVVQPVPTQPTAQNGADGTIGTVVTGGTQPFTYEWEDSNGSFLGDDETLEDLIGGLYFVTVTDNNGCTQTASVDLPGAELEVLTGLQAQASCPGDCNGMIEVIIPNGTAPYTFEWSTGATSDNITNLCPGTYDVFVTDVNGVTGEGTFLIADPTPMTVEIETSPGHAEVIVIGGTPDYLYQWDDVVTTESFIDGVRGGIHVLQITDNNGCKTEIFEIPVPYDTDCLRTRSVMSPNGDGKNDVFYVNCIEDYADHVVTIFNRWGQKIYESDNYDNSWAGTNAKGEDLPEGGYFYVLDYTDNGERKQAKGAVTIVR